jgi:processive 1,2-diacylglycerol beta-glucosyltransferase
MKVLLLSSTTGEGHNSAAKAVLAALEAKGAECEFLDPISFQSESAKKKVTSIYSKIITGIPILFGIIYQAGNLYDRTPLPSPVLHANAKYADKLAKYITDNGFDAVVCPHLFAMQAMAVVRVKYGVQVPTYCIMTDYTVHPFHKDSKPLDYQFASCEKTKRFLIKRGFDEDKITVSGIPVHPKFSKDMTKREAKEKLGISDDKRVISVFTGGAGCGKILKICKKFDKVLGSEYEVHVFPGRNEELRCRLIEYFGEEGKIKVHGFTSDVNIYMKASEVVLSKPGGLSSTEVATANVPFVHMRAVPGCESYNVRYFKKHGISLYGKTVGKAVKYTLSLLCDSSLAEKMVEAQRATVPRKAADFIANTIIEGKK